MKPENEKYTFEDLVKIVERLRAPGGCPWDAEQTHESLKRNLVEEGYELIEAIDSGDGEKIADESGDLLLQVVFHAVIGSETGEYGIDDVTDAVSRKLIHRHPHVFGTVKADTAEEVLSNWDAIKRADREQKSIAEELRGVSAYLPALMRCEKIQKKACKAGYELESISDTDGLLVPLDAEDGKKLIGDLLFDIVRTAREHGIDPELALAERTNKFIKEFEEFERENK